MISTAKFQKASYWGLKLALSAAFLSAVADRFDSGEMRGQLELFGEILKALLHTQEFLLLGHKGVF